MQDAAPARELWEVLDVVEEILVRIPPDQPACLIRASLACKPWCRLLSGHRFRSRYSTLHKTPPILGFLHSWQGDVERFVPITNFRPRNPKRRDCFVLDCRHGRVLLWCELDKKAESEKLEGEEDEEGFMNLVVWDPVSGSRMELREPNHFPVNYSAAVLCAVEGCDHTACNSGPFSVLYISHGDEEVYEDRDDEDGMPICAHFYSSETREWAEYTGIGVGRLQTSIVGKPSVLVGQQLFFLLKRGRGWGILKYDLGMHCLSVIDLPSEPFQHSTLLVSGNDGGLGVVHIDHCGLCTQWSIEVSLGVASCVQLREINLKTKLLPLGPVGLAKPKLVGFVEGTDIILVLTYIGAFMVDLKSLRLSKLTSKMDKFKFLWGLYENLFLYTSFNKPPAVEGVAAKAKESEARRVDVEV